ncbi:MAG: hypothetical protein K6F69_05115 [Treponema sp.]|nr:hypothetical protein [Treponema sp.]
MEKFIDVLKIFFEKHLIPTVLSLVFSAVVYLVVPENNWIINKITDVGFYLLCAGIFFLIIEFVVYFYRTLSERKCYAKEHKKYKDRDEREAMEKLWSYIDELTESDRSILYSFIKNGNKTIEMSERWYSPQLLLRNESIVHCRTIYRGSTPVNQYILDDDFYNNLKHSYMKYGKICHFADEE